MVMLDIKTQDLNPNTPNATNPINRRFSIAPMLDWTTSDYRVFARLLSKQTLLYTEMVTTGALLKGDNPERFLRFEEVEHPIALQLGGSDPKALAQCAKLAESYGYDEVNLNAGCPSDKVQHSLIGAILMAHPEKVTAAMKAMQDACSIPVTLKHRIGLDDQHEYSIVRDFVGEISRTGTNTFIVHARNAILAGLSPKQNREIPPLKYDYVYRLKQDFPDLEIILNGGIKTLDECEQHIQHLDGVMVGREAYNNPWILSDVDSRLFGEQDAFTNRVQALESFVPFVEQRLKNGERLSHLTRHIMGIFLGQPGGKQFRRYLSEQGHKKDASIDVLKQAIDLVNEQLTRAKEMNNEQ